MVSNVAVALFLGWELDKHGCRITDSVVSIRLLDVVLQRYTSIPKGWCYLQQSIDALAHLRPEDMYRFTSTAYATVRREYGAVVAWAADVALR